MCNATRAERCSTYHAGVTPDDEVFLTQLHQALELKDFGPEDPRYVDLEQYPAAVGPDAVKYLRRAIMRTTEGSVFFLSGLRGAGKSTQLRRLQNDLNTTGFAAVRLDAEDYLNLRQPIDVVEFLFFLVGGISDAIDAADWLPTAGPTLRAWQRLREWLAALPERVTLTPSASVGAGIDIPGMAKADLNLKAEIRKDESFVASLREFLEGRLSALVRVANDLVGELVDELRATWERTGREWLGLVVLVDSLDHIRGADFLTIRQSLVDLFDKQSGSIILDRARTVFTVPPYVQIDYEVVRHITNVKVAERNRDPFPDGIAALREVLARRTPDRNLLRLFPDEESLTSLIKSSGGNLRDLFRLVIEVEIQAESLPVSAATIPAAEQSVRNGLLPISDDEMAVLIRVATEQVAPLRSQADWAELSGLYERHLILGYPNGETWYDIHPLIADHVKPPTG